jgi:hypothetical protein
LEYVYIFLNFWIMILFLICFIFSEHDFIFKIASLAPNGRGGGDLPWCSAHLGMGGAGKCRTEIPILGCFPLLPKALKASMCLHVQFDDRLNVFRGELMNRILCYNDKAGRPSICLHEVRSFFSVIFYFGFF